VKDTDVATMFESLNYGEGRPFFPHDWLSYA